MIKLLPYILFEIYIHILALEIAIPECQHCVNCIGTLSFSLRAAETLESMPLLTDQDDTTKSRTRSPSARGSWCSLMKSATLFRTSWSATVSRGHSRTGHPATGRRVGGPRGSGRSSDTFADRRSSRCQRLSRTTALKARRKSVRSSTSVILSNNK